MKEGYFYDAAAQCWHIDRILTWALLVAPVSGFALALLITWGLNVCR